MHLHIKLARVALGLILLFGAACATSQRRPGVEGLPADKLKELGEKYLVAGNMEQALKYLGDAEKKTPNDPQIQYDFGLAYGAMRQPDKSLAYFQKALALKPDYPEAHNAMGALHAEQGRSEEAREAFNRALAVPTYKTPYFAHFNLGRLYEKEGNLTQAIAEYREAVNLNSQYLSAYYRMGTLLETQDRYDEALQAYRDAISVSPDNVEAQYAFGRLSYDMGDLRSATAAFNRVVRLAPYSSMAVSAREHLDQMHPPVDLTPPKVGRGSKNDVSKTQAAKEIAKLQAEIQQEIKGQESDRGAQKLALPQPRPQPDGGRQASSVPESNQASKTLRNMAPTRNDSATSSPQPAQPAPASEPKSMESAQAKAAEPVDRGVSRSVEGVTQAPVASMEPGNVSRTGKDAAVAPPSDVKKIQDDAGNPAQGSVLTAKAEPASGEKPSGETAAPVESPEAGVQSKLVTDHATVQEPEKAPSEENVEQTTPKSVETQGGGGASAVSAADAGETAKAPSGAEPANEAPRKSADVPVAGESGATAPVKNEPGFSGADAPAPATALSSASDAGMSASREAATPAAKAPEAAAGEDKAPGTEAVLKDSESTAAPSTSASAEPVATQASAESPEVSQTLETSEAPESEASSEESTSSSVGAGSAPASGKMNYSVQAGIFRSEQNAKKVRDRLESRGYPVVLKSVPSRTYGVMYKVLIDPAGGAEEARKLMERIRTEEKLEPLLLKSR
jgi:tetratricopeptide (TPR) repeat protein